MHFGYTSTTDYTIELSNSMYATKRICITTRSSNTSVSIANIVDKECPFEIVKHLFILEEVTTEGEKTLTLFDDFESNKDFVVTKYLNEENYTNLALYFVEDITESTFDNIINVMFSVIISCDNAYLPIENMGYIRNGSILNRAATEQLSNLPLKKYFYLSPEDNEELAEVGDFSHYKLSEVYLTNILELVANDIDTRTRFTIPSKRYFKSFETLNEAVNNTNKYERHMLEIKLLDTFYHGRFDSNNHVATWLDYSLTSAETVFDDLASQYITTYLKGLGAI